MRDYRIRFRYSQTLVYVESVVTVVAQCKSTRHLWNYMIFQFKSHCVQILNYQDLVTKVSDDLKCVCPCIFPI